MCIRYPDPVFVYQKEPWKLTAKYSFQTNKLRKMWNKDIKILLVLIWVMMNLGIFVEKTWKIGDYNYLFNGRSKESEGNYSIWNKRKEIYSDWVPETNPFLDKKQDAILKLKSTRSGRVYKLEEIQSPVFDIRLHKKLGERNIFFWIQIKSLID